MPAGRNVVTASDIVSEDTKVVLADVGVLWAARYFTDRPNTGRRRLKPLINLHVPTIGQLDTGQFQSREPAVFGKRGRLPPADQCPSNVFSVSILLGHHSYQLT